MSKHEKMVNALLKCCAGRFSPVVWIVEIVEIAHGFPLPRFMRFIHVPLLPEQVAALDRPGPSMALDTMLCGTRAILAAIAEVVAQPRHGSPVPSRQRVGPPAD